MAAAPLSRIQNANSVAQYFKHELAEYIYYLVGCSNFDDIWKFKNNRKRIKYKKKLIG